MSYQTLERTAADGDSLLDGPLAKDQAMKKKGQTHGPAFGLLLTLLAVSFFLAGRNSGRIGAASRGDGPKAFLTKSNGSVGFDNDKCNRKTIVDVCSHPDTIVCMENLCVGWGPSCYDDCGGTESDRCDQAMKQFDMYCNTECNFYN